MIPPPPPPDSEDEDDVWANIPSMTQRRMSQQALAAPQKTEALEAKQEQRQRPDVIWYFKSDLRRSDNDDLAWTPFKDSECVRISEAYAAKKRTCQVNEKEVIAFYDGVKYRTSDWTKRSPIKSSNPDIKINRRDNQKLEGRGEESFALSLQACIDTPFYRRPLEVYFKGQWALENLKFLYSCDALGKISEPRQRKHCIMMMWQKYISKDAAEMVNLDSHIFRDIGNEYKDLVESDQDEKWMCTRIFDAAQDCVYDMTTRDVYRRFIATSEHTEMLAEPNNVGKALAVNPARKVRRYEELPIEETVEYVWPLVKQVENSGILKTHKRKLKAYAQCFQARELVSFLTEQQIVYTRTQAVALGQRMADCNLVINVNKIKKDCSNFLDGDRLYRLMKHELVIAKSKDRIMQELEVCETSARDEELECFKASLLREGVCFYNRDTVYVIPHLKKIFIYPQQTYKVPVAVLDVKDVKYTIFTRTPTDDDEKPSSTSRKSVTASRKSTAGIIYQDEEKLDDNFAYAFGTSNPDCEGQIAYIDLVTKQRTFSYWFGSQDRQSWDFLEALKKCGASYTPSS